MSIFKKATILTFISLGVLYSSAEESIATKASQLKTGVLGAKKDNEEDIKSKSKEALQAVSEGFSAFKSMAVPPTMPIEGLKPLKGAEACVAAMREAVGDSVDIMVDCHARPSPAMGMQFAKVLEPFGLYFL